MQKKVPPGSGFGKFPVFMGSINKIDRFQFPLKKGTLSPITLKYRGQNKLKITDGQHGEKTT
jgi:hypothetical protein